MLPLPMTGQRTGIPSAKRALLVWTDEGLLTSTECEDSGQSKRSETKGPAYSLDPDMGSHVGLLKSLVTTARVRTLVHTVVEDKDAIDDEQKRA